MSSKGAAEELAKHVETLLGARMVRAHVALSELTIVVGTDEIVPVEATSATRFGLAQSAAPNALRALASSRS